MRHFVALALGAALFLPIASGARAESIHTHRPASGHVFRLAVVGSVDANATFWVAYGPSAGRFGVVRMQSFGVGRYVARVALSHWNGAADLLMGHGTVHTRLGQEPGNPVIIIRHLSPLILARSASTTVHWQAPIG